MESPASTDEIKLWFDGLLNERAKAALKGCNWIRRLRKRLRMNPFSFLATQNQWYQSFAPLTGGKGGFSKNKNAAIKSSQQMSEQSWQTHPSLESFLLFSLHPQWYLLPKPAPPPSQNCNSGLDGLRFTGSCWISWVQAWGIRAAQLSLTRTKVQVCRDGSQKPNLQVPKPVSSHHLPDKTVAEVLTHLQELQATERREVESRALDRAAAR